MQKLNELKNLCHEHALMSQRSGDWRGEKCSSPSTLSMLHRGRRDRRGRAGQGHPGVGVDDRDDLAGASRRRLLVVHVIRIARNP